MAIASNEIGQGVVDALRLPMKGITGIRLELKAGDVVSVDVTYSPEREQVKECFDVIKRYELVEREQTAKERCENKFRNALSFRGQPQLPGWRERIDLSVAAAKEAIALQAQHALDQINGFGPVRDFLLSDRVRHYGPRQAPWPLAH